MNRTSCLFMAGDGPRHARATALEILNINFEEVIAITGQDTDSYVQELRDLPLRVVHGSLRVGVQGLRKYCDGFFICLPEHSQTDRETLKKMIRCFQAHEGRNIVISYANGDRHPVLIPRDLIPDVLEHAEDGKPYGLLLQKYPERTVSI